MIGNMTLVRAITLLMAGVWLLPGGSTENVILVTADGLRWQDLFAGMDPMLMNEKSAHMEGQEALKKKYWRPAPEDRRRALMPFLWNELSAKGVIYGNPARNSSVRVSNGFRVSYPGYSEMLTGRAQDEAIRGNDPIRNPSETVLEFVRRKMNLPRQKVALFGTWDTFGVIGEHTPGSVTINAGYQAVEEAGATPRMKELSRLQFEILTPWESDRHDYVTCELALEYLKTARPRLLHVALGETDDWAHEKRYDRTLETIAYADRCLKKLWDAAQAMPDYRGKTAMMVTTDHGRGGTVTDWSDHGRRVEGADRIWIAMIGPDVPVTGEASGTSDHYQRDVAPTILDWLGLKYQEYTGVLGQPIR